jgi:hypothetical protein
MVRVVFDTTLKLPLQPKDLHLLHAPEEIVDYEEPAEWGVDVATFL